MTKALTNSTLKCWIDEDDSHFFKQRKWFLNKGYVSNTIYINGKPYQERLHRAVMGVKPYEKVTVDHIDGNKLNNSKGNLRVCSQAENNRNAKRFNSTSEYKGVSWKTSNNKWVAQIGMDEQVIYIGLFEDRHEAAHVYDQFAKALHQEYASLNG